MALDLSQIELFCSACQDYVYEPEFDWAVAVGVAPAAAAGLV